MANKIQLPLGLPSDLEVYTIPANTPPWYDFREKGIGGSEVGYLMGLSPYKSSVEVFYEKIGGIEQFMEDNEATFHGKYFENYVKDIWQYWDGQASGYIKNYQAQKKIRDVVQVDSYIINPKFPWLFASLDGIIPQGQFTLKNGAPLLEKPGVLEVKTISSMYARMWEAGIPPQYLTQVHQYMIVLEVDYAEIILLKDGRYVEVLPIERDERLCEQILSITKDFWYNKVLPAKQLKEDVVKHEQDDRMDLSEEAQGEIHLLEPSPDDSEAYKNFQASKQLFDPIEVEGDQQSIFTLAEHLKWGVVEKKAKAMKLLQENRIRKTMADINADKMTFGDSGYCSLSVRKGSSKTTFRNGLKIEVNKEDIEDQIEGLIL